MYVTTNSIMCILTWVIPSKDCITFYMRPKERTVCISWQGKTDQCPITVRRLWHGPNTHLSVQFRDKDLKGGLLDELGIGWMATTEGCGEQLHIQVEAVHVVPPWVCLWTSTLPSVSVTLAMRSGAPAASLQMTPSWVVQLIWQKEEIPSRGIWSL